MDTKIRSIIRVTTYCILAIALSCNLSVMAQLTITEVGTLPEAVANNAVCEGFVDGVPYLYSFAGIDSTKLYSGTHLKSYRINLETGVSESIEDLPGDQGLLGVAASRIGNIIYIVGGYTANSDGTEVSSNKVRRYDVNQNAYLDDAADLIIATDDQVQAVWRDSLLYVITGWSNSTNIRFVQIYDPQIDTWSLGTFLPNDVNYLSFGGSGAIVNDTIYYYGGARSEGSFGIQNGLRMGVINPSNPTEVEWSITTPDASINGYRMAGTTVGDQVHWIGGSNNTYNFDGIAYDGSGGVPPANQEIILDTETGDFTRVIHDEIPMDLRGIANVSDQVKYLAGGMLADQTVTDKVYRLQWSLSDTHEDLRDDLSISLYPNPVSDYINIDYKSEEQQLRSYRLINGRGQIVLSDDYKQQPIDVRHIPTGTYYLELETISVTMIERQIQIIR